MTAVVALMAVFTLAICFIILGSISVELMESLGINEAQFGSLVMGLFLTGCIVQLIIGPLVDKLGYKPIAILGFIVTSAYRLYSSGCRGDVFEHCGQHSHSSGPVQR